MSVSIQRHGSAVVATIAGEVDLDTSPDVLDELEQASAGADRLLIDLGRVTFMDSSGVATLVDVYQTLRSRSATFGIVSASDAAMRVLELARLDQVFRVYASLSEGLADGG